MLTPSRASSSRTTLGTGEVAWDRTKHEALIQCVLGRAGGMRETQDKQRDDRVLGKKVGKGLKF